jgi:hypothetical protein
MKKIEKKIKVEYSRFLMSLPGLTLGDRIPTKEEAKRVPQTECGRHKEAPVKLEVTYK